MIDARQGKTRQGKWFDQNLHFMQIIECANDGESSKIRLKLLKLVLDCILPRSAELLNGTRVSEIFAELGQGIARV